jgi:hypothetical protein
VEQEILDQYTNDRRWMSGRVVVVVCTNRIVGAVVTSGIRQGKVAQPEAITQSRRPANVTPVSRLISLIHVTHMGTALAFYRTGVAILWHSGRGGSMDSRTRGTNM